MEKITSKSDYDTSRYRLDDLQTDGMKIYQDPEKFCFGTDAVILADFASKDIKRNGKVIDLCSGNGIIPLLLHSRRKDITISAVEIDEDAATLAAYNMDQNQLKEHIDIYCCNIVHLPKSMYDSFDAVTVNPPYIPVGKGLQTTAKDITAARHEIYITLEETVKTASSLLKFKGKLFLIHKANRIAEIFDAFQRYDLQAKKLRFVHSKKDQKATLVLISASKNSGPWLDVLEPLIVYNSDGSFSSEIDKIYKRETYEIQSRE